MFFKKRGLLSSKLVFYAGNPALIDLILPYDIIDFLLNPALMHPFLLVRYPHPFHPHPFHPHPTIYILLYSHIHNHF